MPRKYLVAKFDEQTIQRRRVALQHYFKCLVRSPAVFCSILYQFLSTGRKGVSLDPNRVIKSKKKKIVHKEKKPKHPESPTTRSRKRKALLGSSKDLSDLEENKKHRRTEKKNTVIGESPRKKESPLTMSDVGPLIKSPKRLKKKRVPRTMSETRPRKEKRNQTANWTKVTPGTGKDSPRTGQGLLTMSRTHSLDSSVAGRIPKERNKNLVDLSAMFGQKFCIPNEEGPTRAKFLKSNKFQRSSATFYLNKLNAGQEQFELLSDESDNSEEDFVIPEEIMREENIAKLSDIHGLDLESLGIDDVDLAEFDLNDDFLDEATETGVDVDELLDEFGSS